MPEEIKPSVIVEKQEVSAEHPLQYKFTIYKTVKDINGVDVEVEDRVEINNTLELDAEIANLQKQIVDLQVRMGAVKAKQTQIVNYV